MKHSLLSLKLLALVLNFLDTLSNIRITKFMYASLLIKTLCLFQTQAYFAWCFFFLL